MGRSKRQNSQPPKFVEGKDVFATFIAQADMMGQEVAARRAFDEDVSAFLKERKLVEDFDSFRKARAR